MNCICGDPQRGWKETLKLLLLALALLNLFDLAATCWVVSEMGYRAEINPLMRHLFRLGPDVAVTFKLFMLTLFLLIMPICARKRARLVLSGTLLVVAVYGLLAFWHLLWLIRVWQA